MDDESDELGEMGSILSGSNVRTHGYTLHDAIRGAGKVEVNGLYFNHQTVNLDGYKFFRCRFDNCMLVLHTTNFELVHCIVDATTSVQYGTAVHKVIKLFNGRYDWAYSYFPGFVPVVNGDGTLTISDEA